MISASSSRHSSISMLSSPATTARSGTGGGSGGSRLGARRGSAYMDYESTVLALVEAQEGLKRVQLQLQVTEVKHSELKTRYSDLSTKFSTIQSEAIDTSWRYCLEKSSDFHFTPLLDPNLLETEDRAGDYKLEHVLGKGHYSLVRQCVDVSFNSSDPRARTRDAHLSRKLFAESKYVSTFLYDKMAQRDENALQATKYGAGRTPVRSADGISTDDDELAADALDTAFGSFISTSRRGTMHGKRGSTVGIGGSTNSSGFDSHGRNKRLAIKIMSKSNLTSIDAALRVEREIAALKILSPHPNIVRFVKALHGPQNVYIVTEGFRSDLFDFMEDNAHKLNSNIAAVVMRDVITAVAHMAQHQIVHRDLKPENILIQLRSNTIIVKLCDFGLSINVGKSGKSHQFCGSPGFFAPECILTASFDAYVADIFSCGCIGLELLVPQTFFSTCWSRAYNSVRLTPQKQDEAVSVNKTKPLKVASAAARWLGKVGASKKAALISASAPVSPAASTPASPRDTIDAIPRNPNSPVTTARSTDAPSANHGDKNEGTGVYAKSNIEDFYSAIRESIIAAHIEICKRYPEDLAVHEFITRVLHIQPTLRPRPTALLALPWITKASKARACDDLNNHVPVHALHTHNSLLFNSHVGTSTKISTRRMNEGNVYDSVGNTTGKLSYLPAGVQVPAAMKVTRHYAGSMKDLPGSVTIGARPQSPQSLLLNTDSPGGSVELPLMPSQQVQNRTTYPRRMSTLGVGASAGATSSPTITCRDDEERGGNTISGTSAASHHHTSVTPQPAFIKVKDNGLGILGISTDQHRKLSVQRRASFLQVNTIAPRRTSFLATLNGNGDNSGNDNDNDNTTEVLDRHALAQLALSGINGEGGEKDVKPNASPTLAFWQGIGKKDPAVSASAMACRQKENENDDEGGSTDSEASPYGASNVDHRPFS